MSADVYTVIALAARYWFLFLGVLIVLRSFSWLRKDSRLRHKRVKRLPDAGYVGELVVLAGNGELPVGTAIPLPREGTLGSLRICDVVVPVEGVLNKHVAFHFKTGKGLFVEPFYNGEFDVDGAACVKRGKPMVMYHGSRLGVGDAVLRMRLFVGVDAPRPIRARAFEQAFQPEESLAFHRQPKASQPDCFAPVSGEEYEEEYEEEEYEEAPLNEDGAWDEGGMR